jgi:hypothetical protein
MDVSGHNVHKKPQSHDGFRVLHVVIVMSSLWIVVTLHSTLCSVPAFTKVIYSDRQRSKMTYRKIQLAEINKVDSVHTQTAF